MPRRLHNQQGTMLAALGFGAAVIVMMVAIAIPVVKHTRGDNHAQTCRNNLAELLALKERYVIDHDLKRGDKISLDDLLKGKSPLLKQKPICPDGGVYTLGAAGELPACSFVGHALPMAGKKQRYLFTNEVKPTSSTEVKK